MRDFQIGKMNNGNSKLKDKNWINREKNNRNWKIEKIEIGKLVKPKLYKFK